MTTDFFECPEELARAIDRWIATDPDAERLIARKIWDDMQPTVGVRTDETHHPRKLADGKEEGNEMSTLQVVSGVSLVLLVTLAVGSLIVLFGDRR